MRKGQRHKPESIEKIKLKSSGKPVAQMTVTGRLLNIYTSINEAEKVTGIFRFNIRRSCNRSGGIVLANGYLWNYLEDIPDIERLVRESSVK